MQIHRVFCITRPSNIEQVALSATIEQHCHVHCGEQSGDKKYCVCVCAWGGDEGSCPAHEFIIRCTVTICQSFLGDTDIS